MAERFDLAAFAYAHRGLWTPDGPAENSLTAFQAAADAGLGLELDVRPASDGTPVIFHDVTLDRMTQETGAVCERTPAELAAVAVGQSEDTIPTLNQLLDAWTADTPLLVELKIDGPTDPDVFAATVSALLNDFPGPAAAMSFDPRAVRAFPETLQRGLLVPSMKHTGQANFQRAIDLAPEIGAEYLGLWKEDVDQAPDESPTAVWTIASETDLAALPDRRLGIIFEHLDPALVRP